MITHATIDLEVNVMDLENEIEQVLWDLDFGFYRQHDILQPIMLVVNRSQKELEAKSWTEGYKQGVEHAKKGLV